MLVSTRVDDEAPELIIVDNDGVTIDPSPAIGTGNQVGPNFFNGNRVFAVLDPDLGLGELFIVTTVCFVVEGVDRVKVALIDKDGNKIGDAIVFVSKCTWHMGEIRTKMMNCIFCLFHTYELQLVSWDLQDSWWS